MSQQNYQPTLKLSQIDGQLILRIFLGTMLVLHGIAKINNGIDGIEGMLVGAGLPAFLAYGVYIGEVLAPALLIVGFQVRLAAIVVAINMLFAIGLVHMGHFFELGKSGGWALELQAFYLVTAVVVALQAKSAQAASTTQQRLAAAAA